MSFRSRRSTMRPAREFNVVLRARDQQVSTLQEYNDSLKEQLEIYERRLTNARANAHADARAYQLQERRIEQMRLKLRDMRAASAAQRRALEDIGMQLEETQEENIRHLARIAKLEEALQAKSSPVSTNDVEYPESGVSHDDIIDVLARVTIDLEAATRITEEIISFDKPWDTIPRANRVEMGIQTVSGDVSGETGSGSSSRQLQSAEEMGRLVSQAQATSEQDQCRIRDLEVDLENARRLNEELRSAAEEERRLLQNLKAPSVQEQSRVASLETAARQDQQALKVLEATAHEHRSEIDNLEAQITLLRTLLEESRAFSDDLEESYSSIVACKDTFIQDLREKVEELATSWSQQREASLHEAQERLAATDIEFLELRLELEGAQRNAVVSTNRIIQLEAEASVARHRLRTADAENGDLREELGVASERAYALEDELVAAQGRLDSAEHTIRQLRHELEGYLEKLPNKPRFQDDIQDVNDTDSASDVGSMDTLVMDPDEQSQLQPQSSVKDVDSPAPAKQDEQLSQNDAPLSAHDLEVRLEAMTLKFEAAEAARICGEDVEDMLRAKLKVLSNDNLRLNTQLSPSPSPIKSDPEMRADRPSEEWHSLATIPEEDERSTSPVHKRVVRPRIQTSRIPTGSFIATKNAVTPITAESPLLPSPTLSDIWFSDMRVSLALVETESSVLDWDLPSPGGDSDCSS